MTRYPLAALAAACGLSEHALCQRLGVKGSDGQRAIHEGLSELLADRYAVKMGLHPFEVWPELAAALVNEVDETHRDEMQARIDRRRASWRRYRTKVRQERPEECRAADARYYAECSEYVKARARKRYWADPEAARAARRARYAKKRLREQGMAA